MDLSEKEIIKKWNAIKEKALADKPKTFLDFCESFMEYTPLELEDDFHWCRDITEPLLDKVAAEFNKKESR